MGNDTTKPEKKEDEEKQQPVVVVHNPHQEQLEHLPHVVEQLLDSCYMTEYDFENRIACINFVTNASGLMNYDGTSDLLNERIIAADRHLSRKRSAKRSVFCLLCVRRFRNTILSELPKEIVRMICLEMLKSWECWKPEEQEEHIEGEEPKPKIFPEEKKVGDDVTVKQIYCHGLMLGRLKDTEEEVIVRRLRKSPKLNMELVRLQRLRHPNLEGIKRIYHEGPDEYYIVQDHLDAKCLTDVLELWPYAGMEGLKMTEDEMSFVLKWTFEALHFLHKHGIVHGDLKSDNVMLSKTQNNIKLMYPSWDRYQNRRTRNTVVGTPYWLPPEMIIGTEVTEKIDVWALAVMLTEMCVGEPPFMEYPPLNALYRINTEGLPALPSDFGEDLRDVFTCMSKRSVKERSSMEELRKHRFVTQRSYAETLLQDLIHNTSVVNMKINNY